MTAEPTADQDADQDPMPRAGGSWSPAVGVRSADVGPTVRSPLFVIADVHGHRAEMREALRDAGLIDEACDWSGRDSRLWFLGDYVDRGPDGIGVIDDVRRWQAQARSAGGEVGTLFGNHEGQLLAAHEFGDAPVEGWDQPGGFHGGWKRFGGNVDDLRRLTDDHVSWIRALPAIALVDGFLLVHSDTARYLEFGTTVESVNDGVAEALRTTDSRARLEFCMAMSSRGAFHGLEVPHPDDAVSRMLHALGGEVLVHGHSTLISHFGFDPSHVKEALSYAGGRVVAVDGGVYEGGRVLLTRLPTITPARASDAR